MDSNTEMRKITDHKVHLGDPLDVYVTDDKGTNGAHCRYDISGYDVTKNPSAVFEDQETNNGGGITILFQNGPVSENGENGITNEVILAIAADRLRCLQRGPFPCKENELALGHVEAALQVLKDRTHDRMARGVEGKQEA